MWSVIRKETEDSIFGGGNIQQRRKVQIFEPEGDPAAIPFLSETS